MIMDVRNRILENAKKYLKEQTQEIGKMDAAYVFSELADWCYSQSEEIAIDDELDVQDDE